MLLNCAVGEDSWESLGQQGDPSNQSILKEISPEYSLEGLMLKLTLQNFGHLMWRADSDSDAGKDWRQEEKGMSEDEMIEWCHRLNGHGFGWTPGVWWWTERPGVLQGCKESHSATKLNWTYWARPCAPDSLVVGLQLAYHSHATTSLLLIAYTKYLLSFGVPISLNCLHMFF